MRQMLLKGLRRLALAALAVTLMAGPSFAMDVYLVAQEFTYQGSVPANPHYSPVLAGITMWGFAPADASFNPTGPASVPGPAISVPPADPVLNIHVKNSLPTRAPVYSFAQTPSISIVIPGLVQANAAPVWATDSTGLTVASNGSRGAGDLTSRIRSFTYETAPGANGVYSWTNVRPGSYVYQSGSHQQVQIQMGLYGGVSKLAGGTPFSLPVATSEVILFYSEIDPELHYSVQSGLYGQAPPASGAGTPVRGQRTSTVDYLPKYFLINGVPYSAANPPPDITCSAAGQGTLIRFLNAGLKEHTPTLTGGYVYLIGEDGNQYPYPKQQYSALLPAGKAMDAIFAPTVGGRYVIFDRSLHLTNSNVSPGGMLAYLNVPPGGSIMATDTVTITKVAYAKASKKLTVTASSNLSGAALTAQGLGDLTLSTGKKKTASSYKGVFKGVKPKPASVTVSSSGGGSDTKPVP